MENKDINNINKEIWVNLGDGYRISNYGNFQYPSGKMHQSNSNGYQTINIKNEQKFLHRLVAETFIPNPHNKPEVNHKNLNKSDNRVSNLEWVDSSENVLHSYRNRKDLPLEYSEYKNKVIDLYSSGLSIDDIANIINYKPYQIRYFLKKNNLIKPKSEIFSEKEIKEIISMRLSGESYTKIAGKFNRLPATITRAVSDYFIFNNRFDV